MAVTLTARSLIAVGSLALVALIPRPAVADAEPETVEIVATGERTATSAVEVLVRELLKRLPVVIRWASAPEIDPRDVLARRTADSVLAARVWIDLSDRTGARLFVANAASDHFLVRLVPAEEGHREVEEEAVAQIIASSVEAILAGGEIGVTREVAVRQMAIEPRRDEAAQSSTAPSPQASRPPSREGGFSSRAGAFLGLRALGAGPVVGVEPGLLAAVVVPQRWVVQPFLVLEAQYDAPVEWQAHGVAVQLEGGGANLQPGLQARVSSRVSVQASLGLGGEAFYVQSHAAQASTVAARGPFWLAARTATARVGVEVDVAAPVSLFGSAGFDVDLSGVQFNVSNSGSDEPSVVPWRVWPLARLGANFHFESAHRNEP
jgi:hypothetical protein